MHKDTYKLHSKAGITIEASNRLACFVAGLDYISRSLYDMKLCTFHRHFDMCKRQWKYGNRTIAGIKKRPVYTRECIIE